MAQLSSESSYQRLDYERWRDMTASLSLSLSLTAIASGHPESRLDDLLPRNLKPSSQVDRGGLRRLRFTSRLAKKASTKHGLIRQERPLQRLDFAQVAAGQDQAPEGRLTAPKGWQISPFCLSQKILRRESLPGTALTTSGAMSRQSSQKVSSPVTTLAHALGLVADSHHPRPLIPTGLGP